MKRDEPVENKNQGVFTRLWGMVRRPSTNYSVLTIASVFFVVGILFWGGFHTVLDQANTMDFCISCHEMKDTVYKEYQQTIHYSNRTGVQATCPDCHVPKSWGRKIMRKMEASLELWAWWTGAVDTKEKFEAKRMEMATREWKRMEASSSIECRNCHSFDNMDIRKQKPKAKETHAQAIVEKEICIDCHKGIAHMLPKEYKGNDEEE